MSVQTEDGELLGKIVDVLETGANDVYIIRGEAYGEVLIPVIDETILETDVANGIVIVRLPDGLLPD
jgi:16S rRNA processing protein RimM